MAKKAKSKAAQSSSSKHIEMAVTEVPVYSCTYYWKIKDFQQLPHGPGDSMNSTDFSTYRENEGGNREGCDNLKWSLSLYPRGNRNENKEYLSLFLSLAENGRGERVKATYSFSIGADLESMDMVYAPASDIFAVPDDEDADDGGDAAAADDDSGDDDSWGYEQFLHHKTDKISYLLEQSEFFILCELSHSSSINDIYAKPAPDIIDLPKSQLEKERSMSDLMRMYERKALTDAVIEVDGSQIHVHKVVLAAKSSVFEKLFESGFAEASTNTIKISDIDKSTCEMMVAYMYGACELPAQLDMARAGQLLHAAEKYELGGLKLRCMEALRERISGGTVCELLVMSDRYQAGRLKAHCMRYVMGHRGEVTRSQAWGDLCRHHPHLLSDCITLG